MAEPDIKTGVEADIKAGPKAETKGETEAAPEPVLPSPSVPVSLTTTGKLPRPQPLWRRFLPALIDDIAQHGTFGEAAQIAYWAVLALFPFLMFLLTMIGYLPLHGLDTEVTATLYQTMPTDAAKLIDQTVHEVLGRQRGGLLIITLLGALWTASSGVNALGRGLNRAFGVRETRPYLWLRLQAVLGTLVLVLLSVTVLTAVLVGPTVGHTIWGYLGVETFVLGVWRQLRFVVALGALTALVSLIYFVLPNVHRRYRPFTLGSLVAMALWIGAALLFRMYLAHFGSFTRTYGALGTAVVLLTYLFWSGFFFLLGGEVDATIDRLGRRASIRSAAKMVAPQDKALPKT